MIKIKIKIFYYIYLFKRSTNLFRERLLDLLLETKRREFFYNKQKELQKEFQKSDDNPVNDEDNYARTCMKIFSL